MMGEKYKHSVIETITYLQHFISDGNYDEEFGDKQDELCDWLEWRISDGVWDETKLDPADWYNKGLTTQRQLSRQFSTLLFDTQLRTLAHTVVNSYKRIEYKNHG